MDPRLAIVSEGGAGRELALGAGRTRVVVSAADQFRLALPDAGGVPPTLRVLRVDNALLVSGLPDERELELSNFFGACRPGRDCALEIAAPDAPAALSITNESAPLAALSDGSFLLHGSTDGLATLPTSVVAASEPASSPSWIAIAAGLAGLGLAAGAAGGGGGGDEPVAVLGASATAPTTPAAPTAPTTPTPVSPTAPATPGDTIAPTLSITDGVAAATATGATVFTFRFSEAVVGFDASDVRVTGGTAGALVSAGDGLAWTMSVAPAPGVASGLITVEVAAGAATDASGNLSGAARATQAIDTAVPTLAITDAVAAATTAAATTFTFRFSEPVTGFDASDVRVSGGTAGALASAGDGLAWTTTVVPAPGTTGEIAVEVAAGAALDAAGNPSAAARATQGIDTAAPTLAITDGVAAAITNATTTFTFRFSEAVSGFGAGDVRVTGGSAGTLVSAGDGRTWTMAVTPTAGVASGQIAVTVDAGAAVDGVGNASGAASATQAYDTRAPSQRISLFRVVDDLAPNTGNLTSGGSTNDRTPTVTLTLDAVLGTGETLTLTRNGTAIRTLAAGQSTVTFTEPTLGAGTYAYAASVVDGAGNLSTLDLNGGTSGTEFSIRVT